MTELYWCTLTIISSFQKPAVYKPSKKENFRQVSEERRGKPFNYLNTRD
jgi:hypothetical protein